MKQIFAGLFLLLIAMTAAISAADAARLGGGRSSGMQRNSITKPAAPAGAPSQNVAPAPRPAQPVGAPAPQPSGMSRWLGPLAGLAAGVGLAALFSHFGMGEGFSSIVMMLLLAAAVFFVIRLLFRRSQAATPQPMQYAGGPAPAGYEPVASASEPASVSSSAPLAAAPEAAVNVPAGFDVDGFLRQAKLNFVRLQAAHDAKNLEDIRNFTTPEMFAEIKLDMNERGDKPQQTDVVTLNAQLLDVTTESTQHIASVRFSGNIRETEAGAPEPLDEVWHLTKPTAGSGGWIIAGIQQVN